MKLNLLKCAAISGILFLSVKAQEPAGKYSTPDSLKFVWAENETATIFPEPVSAKYFNEYLVLSDNNKDSCAFIIASNESEIKAFNLFNTQLSKYGYSKVSTVKTISEVPRLSRLIIVLNSNAEELKKYGDQAYEIKPDISQKNIIYVSGSSEKGLIYGTASLAQLVIKKDQNILMRKAKVMDYPKFTQRIFSISNRPLVYDIDTELDWMVRYKIESIALHNDDYSWDKIDSRLKGNLKKYSAWKKKYGGVESLLMLNLYKGSHIQVSNKSHINKIISIIDTAYCNGVTRIMILSDDSPPFRYGEGYISNDESERKAFRTLAESHCYLMKEITEWSRRSNYNITFMYCPAFYTYQDMYYGDIRFYQDTPWENDAFEPFNRDLRIIGENMPPEVQIIWTGPDVCSRTITDEDINDWSKKLHGRKPFLFDNTVFAGYEFTSRTMFTSYMNNYPKDFNTKTGGNGYFINSDGSIGDGTGETNRAVTMTANAYMWEGDKYNPDISFHEAMIKLYGSNAINTLMEYKKIELELTKTIKQRELREAVSKLEKSIEKIKVITGLSPSKYQQNISRLKALETQLKYSVKKKESNAEFKKRCLTLDQKRKQLINKIEEFSFFRLSYLLQAEMVKLPDLSNMD